MQFEVAILFCVFCDYTIVASYLALLDTAVDFNRSMFLKKPCLVSVVLNLYYVSLLSVN